MTWLSVVQGDACTLHVHVHACMRVCILACARIPCSQVAERAVWRPLHLRFQAIFQIEVRTIEAYTDSPTPHYLKEKKERKMCSQSNAHANTCTQAHTMHARTFASTNRRGVASKPERSI